MPCRTSGHMQSLQVHCARVAMSISILTKDFSSCSLGGVLLFLGLHKRSASSGNRSDARSSGLDRPGQARGQQILGLSPNHRRPAGDNGEPPAALLIDFCFLMPLRARLELFEPRAMPLAKQKPCCLDILKRAPARQAPLVVSRPSFSASHFHSRLYLHGWASLCS